jgi:hypothetical protein
VNLEPCASPAVDATCNYSVDEIHDPTMNMILNQITVWDLVK